MRRGSKQHEEELKKTMLELQKEGYRVIELRGHSPDAIAIKDNRIIAVEVLGQCWRNNPKYHYDELHSGWTYAGKKKQYSMFDDVKIVTFIRSGEGDKHPELPSLIMDLLSNVNVKQRTVEIWDHLPFFVSQRRVRQVLVKLEKKKMIESETQSNGRYGRFNVWKKSEQRISS
jgi:hypothetical protein